MEKPTRTYAHHTKMCASFIPFIPSLNDQKQLSVLKNIDILTFSCFYFPFGFEGRMWDLIVSVPDYCLSFYLPFPFLHWCFVLF